ncbi:sulfotransferase family protein [Ichthyenterobacterium sp. W332]|uniref:Sulfotransferase family protein n=1 Tax=Microcosmobacter mediterraneus TaxID=3075607 RepID=A0ABU2YNR5_9FLAO|nr:sulfotransferase family protein [Ichthyenterobacterium sp. W332]MDT0559472.1 sulfotransferase family protein [Ichthyenterobacterium sp. W332]
MPKHICLWSGPRNISTTLMYSFAQRKDTKVFDEPLYAHYLSKHPKAKQYHPEAEAILNTIEHDGNKVMKMLLHHSEKPIYFYKQMIHHLLDLDRKFMTKTINIILTRNPKEMLPSFDKVISNPHIDDVGYKLHVNLLNYFKNNTIEYVILDSKRVLLNPEEVLKKLCDAVDIPFYKTMLHWDKGARSEDGIWAKHWYSNIHNSTGFIPYKPKTEPFPNHLKPLLKECQPYYEQLLEEAL